MYSVAYQQGGRAAYQTYGLTKEAFLPPGIGNMVRGAGKAIGAAGKWLGRGVSVVPGLGTLTAPVINGASSLISSAASGHGLGEALSRAGTQAATGFIPGGGGIAAGMAADYAADKMFAPKPRQGPNPSMVPGMMGQGHLPGMVG